MTVVLLFAIGIASAVTLPSINFTASEVTGPYPLSTTFTATTIGLSPPLSYEWNFGDGSGSTKMVPGVTHVYTNPGKYTVSLVVTDYGIGGSQWLSMTKVDYIFVTHNPPVAGFTRIPSGESAGMVPLDVHFTSTTTGEAYTLLWDFGDGDSSTATNPVHQYTESGTYTINLTATNDGGSDSVTGTITARPAKPVASFIATSPTEGPVPLAVQFQDLSTGEGTFTYHWIFGDGQHSDIQNPLHAYGTIGLKTVSLIVSNDPLEDNDDNTTTRINYINVTNVTGPVICPTPEPTPEPTQCPTGAMVPTTVGVVRNGIWYLHGIPAFSYGIWGDTPLLGDWNGDGVVTAGVVRNGAFYLKNSNTGGNADLAFIYGLSGDTPIAGDWNGDGTDTIGIIRNGVLYLRNTNTAGNANLVIGLPGDKPVIGR